MTRHGFEDGYAALFIPLNNIVFIICVELMRHFKIFQYIAFGLLILVATPFWLLCDDGLTYAGITKAWSVVAGCWVIYALRYHDTDIMRKWPQHYRKVQWVASFIVIVNIFEATLYEPWIIYFEKKQNLLFPGNVLTGIILLLTVSHPNVIYTRQFGYKTTKNNNNNDQQQLETVAISEEQTENSSNNTQNTENSTKNDTKIAKNAKNAKNSNDTSGQTAANNTVAANNTNSDVLFARKVRVRGILDGKLDDLLNNSFKSIKLWFRKKLFGENRTIPVIDYDYGMLWIICYTVWNIVFGVNVLCIEPLPGFSLHLGIPLYFILFYAEFGEWIELRAYSLILYLYIDGLCSNYDERVPFFELIECEDLELSVTLLQILSIVSFIIGMVLLLDQIYSQIRYNRENQVEISDNNGNNGGNGGGDKKIRADSVGVEMDVEKCHTFAQYLVNRYMRPNELK